MVGVSNSFAPSTAGSRARSQEAAPPVEGVITKWCPKCSRDLPLEAFARSRGRRLGRAGWCKGCASVYMASGTKRRSVLKRTYGITAERYDQMLRAQAGACAVCKHPPAKKTRQSKSLAVDHDHATGEVRGLLCGRCNTALGLLREDPANIVALFNYLDDWNRRRAGL